MNKLKQETINTKPEYIEQIFEFHVPKGQKPERLDQYITRMVQNATRTKVQKAIDEGRVFINGNVAKSSRKVQPLDHIICRILKPPPMQLVPQNIPLDIVYEDDYLMVVNKPAGMVVHPAFGNRYGTMVNAILYYLGKREPISIDLDDEDEESEMDEDARILISDEVRPGIVHRIDKDTSGLLLVAKAPEIHPKLAEQFANHAIDREYWAICWGRFSEPQGTYIGDIGRSPHNRKMFAVLRKGGKYARTDYFVQETFEYNSLVKFRLHTGRTHQIRVHSSHYHHPILGDELYGGNKIVFGGEFPSFRQKANELLRVATHQMLHARTLGFIHPVTQQQIHLTSELPKDFQQCLEILRR